MADMKLARHIQALALHVESGKVAFGGLPEDKLQDIVEELLDNGVAHIVDPDNSYKARDIESEVLDAIEERTYSSLPREQQVGREGQAAHDWKRWFKSVRIDVSPTTDIEELDDTGWEIVMKSRDNDKYAGVRTARGGLYRIFESHFDRLLDRLEEIQKSLEKREDLVDQKPTLDAVKRIYRDVEELWADFSMALDSEYT